MDNFKHAQQEYEHKMSDPFKNEVLFQGKWIDIEEPDYDSEIKAYIEDDLT